MRIIKVFVLPVITIVILFLSYIAWPNTANAAGIELSISQGKTGSTVNIRGNGFSGKLAAIYWDKRLMLENVPISEQGTLQHNLVIPLASKGNHSIHIEDDSNWSASTASINFTVLPSIRIFPDIGTELTQVAITGSGFNSHEKDIRIILDGNIQPIVSINADKYGTWNTLFTVPKITRGEHYFTALGSTTNADEIEEIPFVVTPWARIEPTSGPTGTEINIRLWGLQTDEHGINLTWDGETIKSNLDANTEGALIETFNTPENPEGKHSIGILRRVSTTEAKFTEMYFKVIPDIALQSTKNEMGTNIKLTGTGFASNEPLVITIDKTTIKSDLSTNYNGSFNTVLQVPKTETIAHIIVVKDRSGNSDQENFATEKASLTTPQLITPTNGYKIDMVNSIFAAFVKSPKYLLGRNIEMPQTTFIWSKLDIGDRIDYILQIAADNDFSTPVLEKRITISPEYTLPEDVALPPGNYGWRVKAVNSTGLESSWSQVYKLEIALMPTQVLILSSTVMVLLIALIGLGIWGIYIIIARRRNS
jgi:hypothetical protein